MKINDELLEVLGKVYRKLCGPNDVLMTEARKPVTFEDFVTEVRNIRDRRGLAS